MIDVRVGVSMIPNRRCEPGVVALAAGPRRGNACGPAGTMGPGVRRRLARARVLQKSVRQRTTQWAKFCCRGRKQHNKRVFCNLHY